MINGLATFSLVSVLLSLRQQIGPRAFAPGRMLSVRMSESLQSSVKDTSPLPPGKEIQQLCVDFGMAVPPENGSDVGLLTAACHRVSHKPDELIEQVTRIVWAWRGFGMMLHGEYRTIFEPEARERVVVEVQVGRFPATS